MVSTLPAPPLAAHASPLSESDLIAAGLSASPAMSFVKGFMISFMGTFALAVVVGAAYV